MITDFMDVVRSLSEGELLKAAGSLSSKEVQIIYDAFEAGELSLSQPAIQALCRLLEREPTKLPQRSRVAVKTEMAAVYASRYDAGEILWHPEDDIHQNPEDRAGGEHGGRLVHRLRNGSDVFGVLEHVAWDDQTEIESFGDELQADRFAVFSDRCVHGSRFIPSAGHVASETAGPE
jgi:hypothetical protein